MTTPLTPSPLLTRRTLLGTTATAAGGWLVHDRAHAAPAGGFAMVTNGTAQAVIVPPPDLPSGDTQTGHAVDTLVDYVRKSTGVELPVRRPDDLSDPALPDGRVYVGWTGPDATDRLEVLLDGLDIDGYVIDITEQVSVIVGGSDWGTRYGVYEVLERFLGVRWLLPGPDGEDVPVHRALNLPAGTIREEPTFLSRTLPYLFESNQPNAQDWASDDPQVQWATRQRTHTRITRVGNHNLFNVFPTAVYADPTKPTYQPEIFPLVDGEVVVPSVGSTKGWQPRFDIQETVDIAVAWIIDFFDDHPDEPLVSLAVNDGRGFSETDLEPDVINSVGLTSASESYYAWLNTVVTEVLTQRPDLDTKIFPVLAYTDVTDPPSFALHPNVVPMITKESHSWSDPESRIGFQTVFDQWHGTAEQLAIYDYASGARYLVPRLYAQDLQAAYAYAHQRGMKYTYCDMSPNVVGEGPKTWVYGKMMWDIDVDVEALTREWCERAVGRRAAGTLRRYFQMWEKFWAGPAQETASWQFSRNRTYMSFILTDYLAQVSDADARSARRLLERTLERAETPAQQRRAELIMKSFEYYESGYLSYPRTIAAVRGPGQARAVVTSIRDELADRVAQASRRVTIESEHEADPILRHRTDHRRYQHTWTGYSGSQFWHLYDYLQQREPDGGRITDDLEQLATSGASDAPGARFSRLLLQAVRGDVPQLAPNGSFEEGNQDAPGWRLIGDISRVTGEGTEGSAALRLTPYPDIPGTGQEQSIVQAIPITPGLCAFRVRFRASSLDIREAQVSVKAHLWTPTGSNIYAFAQPMQLLRPTGLDWTWVGLCEDVPASALEQPVGQLRLVASLLGFEGEGVVYVDDAQVFSEGSAS